MIENQRLRLALSALAVGWLTLGRALAADIPARLEWDQRVELGTPVSGVVARVAVKQGQRVVTGAVLLELDPRLFQARLAEAEATLVQSRQHRDEAMRELARTRELFDRTLLAVHDRQVAEIAAAEAEAAFRRAESGLVRARLDLEYSRLAAPFDAWVVEVMAAPGEAVVSRLQARPLAVVVPAGRMRARALLAREQLAPLRLGSPAGVTVDGQRYSGTVVGLALEPEPGVAERPLYAVEVSFEIASDTLLRPGEKARIDFEQ